MCSSPESYAERSSIKAIAQSRATILPSHAYETFGKTILESYARARPVIATDLGSRRELVHEGTTGLLYQVGNVGELAQAIQFLSDQPELTHKMGLAGREMVRQRYSPEAHYETLVALYQHVIEVKKTGVGASSSLSAHRVGLLARKKAVAVPLDSNDFVPLQRLALTAAVRELVRVSGSCSSEPQAPGRVHRWKRRVVEIQRCGDLLRTGGNQAGAHGA